MHPLRVDHMHRAGDAGIERMNRAQDFERTIRIGDRRIQQRRFIGAALPGASRGPAFQVVGTTA